METRKITRTFALRASQGEEGVLVGRALTYLDVSSNELAPNVREMVMPGAFRESLASGQTVHCTLNHDMSGIALGSTDNGSLKITDCPESLNFRCQLNMAIAQHADVFRAVQSGLLHECSFAFDCLDEDVTEGKYQGQDCVVRCIRKAKLFDVSVVNSPFYGDSATAVSARAAAVKVEQDRKLRIARAALAVAEDKRNQRIADAVRDGFQKAPDMEGVSKAGMSDWMAGRLADCLAALPVPHRYVAHAGKYNAVFAIPESVFDDDPDISDEDALRAGHFYQYGVDPDSGYVTVRYDPEKHPEGPGVEVNSCRALLAELRNNSVLRRRMRESAGIFHAR